MITRKPFAESRALREGREVLRNAHEVEGDIEEALTHYEFDNGRVVSVLRSIFGWEAWGSEPGGLFGPAYFTSAPILYDSEAKALVYRDAVAVADDPKAVGIGDGTPMEDR